MGGRDGVLPERCTDVQQARVVRGRLRGSKHLVHLLHHHRLPESPTVGEELVDGVVPVILAQPDHPLHRQGVGGVGRQSHGDTVADIAHLGQGEAFGGGEIAMKATVRIRVQGNNRGGLGTGGRTRQ